MYHIMLFFKWVVYPVWWLLKVFFWSIPVALIKLIKNS